MKTPSPEAGRSYLFEGILLKGGSHETFQHSRIRSKEILKVLQKELRGLSPNFHIHVSVSDLVIPTIGPPIFLQQKRRTDRGNI
jgi:hypothetical protein